MEGYILLADGLRLEGTIRGTPCEAAGWLSTNTSVVGFQELATDPAYKNRLLVFTYPEVGNIGITAAFSESPRVQAGGLVVKVLSEIRSHYLSEDSMEGLLRRDGVPCLTGVDTRTLAVHLREHGEMPAAIARASADPAGVRRLLESAQAPRYAPTPRPESGESLSGSGPRVAVLDLGMRASELRQLARCCRPVVLPYDADARAVERAEARGLIVSDGPSHVEPPPEAVALLRTVAGRMPVLGCGLGHLALGAALGCRVGRLFRGHHGASYPVRDPLTGQVAITCQRHTAVLERDSVPGGRGVRVTWENLNDASVEGIRTEDGMAEGIQMMPLAPYPGAVSPYFLEFAKRLS